MRNLAIDMGNTRIKAGLFSDDQIVKVSSDLKTDELSQLVAEENVQQVIVSSVASDLDDFEQQSGLSNVLKLTPETTIPIKNCYDTPSTLGMDRLAGVIGANQLYPGSNCLVIDTGTTITFDFLDENRNYLGGGITPGVELRFKSLNQHTYQLPLMKEKGEKAPLIGKDTRGSIRSGVLNGVLAEIEGIIRRYEHKFSTLKVVLCGGDAGFFESNLKDSIFVVPHLVLIGLNSILLNHAQNK